MGVLAMLLAMSIWAVMNVSDMTDSKPCTWWRWGKLLCAVVDRTTRTMNDALLLVGTHDESKSWAPIPARSSRVFYIEYITKHFS